MGVVPESEWALRREVLARYEASGLSLEGFARQEGIAYSRLLGWRKRLGVAGAGRLSFASSSTSSSGPAGSVFQELVRHDGGADQSAPWALRESHASESTGSAPVEIVLPGGVLIRVREGADAALVRVAVEGRGSCL